MGNGKIQSNYLIPDQISANPEKKARNFIKLKKKKKKANQYKTILIESTINKRIIDFLLNSTHINTHDTYILKYLKWV